jgi:hemolysin D
VVDAEVIDITADAVENEKQGLVYKMRLRMKDPSLWVNGQWVDLLPGMIVSAEVKTGHRRMIEFFLAPLLRSKSESLGER